MTNFLISGIAYRCGQSRAECVNKTQSCRDCIESRLKELGFEITPHFDVFKVISTEENLEMERNFIWQKFLDVLNIKHVVVMDKESGLALLNYPVSLVDIDADLLSGFIQANVNFSESNNVTKSDKQKELDHPFFEFQYKNFNILMKNGELIRICLILDHTASIRMRTNLEQLLINFEISFSDRFINIRKTGQLNSSGLIEIITHSFDIDLVFPMTLAQAIPPEVLEKINQNQIQKVVLTLAREALNQKPFFFINTLLEKVNKIMNFDSKVILHEIFRLYQEKVIKTTPIETIASNIENQQQLDEIKDEKIKIISSIAPSDEDVIDFKNSLSNLDESSGKLLLKDLIKNGKNYERVHNYQSSLKEYNKALLLAKSLELKDDLNKISQLIFNLDKRSKQIELDFCVEMGENAEKNRDQLGAIHHYQKAIKILEGFLIYNQNDQMIKKLKKKIQRLREAV
jgi:tetratricopeptide (TPR) repeat protein